MRREGSCAPPATAVAPAFTKVLVANRGEVALRIARTLREMGSHVVAIYSEADRDAPHVRGADSAYCIGPAPAAQSYLRGDAIVALARRIGVDAVHPGYGFLAENADFAAAVGAAGMTFIGPPPAAMRVMGHKTAARAAMQAAHVPTVPGSDGPLTSLAQASKLAADMGYPVMLKAAAGGGGKGMRLVTAAPALAAALRAAASEAASAFDDDTVYMEKALLTPRHIEVQVISGPDGATVAVGERECSMQRRHQKVLEEAPGPRLDPGLRAEMAAVACSAARAVDYRGVGTVEFLLDRDGRFFFLEMNTRLQVEHSVTEACYGVDLVRLQVEVAAGRPLAPDLTAQGARGHSIEARLYAEDPEQNFLPAPGRVTTLRLPAGPGVRVDCGIVEGGCVSGAYDPLIAKITVWAPDRAHARARMLRALDETCVAGIASNRAFLRRLVASEAFAAGAYHTGTVAEVLAEGGAAAAPSVDVATAAAAIARLLADSARPGAIAPARPRTPARGAA